MNNPAIRIILTGGTIDSHWDGKLDTAVSNTSSRVPTYFENLILYAKVEFVEICMKDSRSITPEDLDRVIECIESASADKILVTHGTYTMPDSAKYIRANLKSTNKTVVLTGSMIPLEGFLPSDAPFNLGYALGSLELLPPGVYLAMNGRCFNPDEVAKNLSEGKFYSVFDKKQ